MGIRPRFAVLASVISGSANCGTAMEEGPHRPESPTDGFDDVFEAYDHLRASIQELAVEFRFRTAEVERLKRLMCQLAHQATVEKQERQAADAARDRQLRTLMTRLSNAVNGFIAQENADDTTPEVGPDDVYGRPQDS